MPKFPKIAAFLLKFLALYFILVIGFNALGLRDGFNQAFAKWADGTYKNYIPQAEASFQPRTEGEHDLNIVFVNIKTREEKMAAARRSGQGTVNLDISASPFSIWDFFLLQLIVFISLVLASPIGWKRMGRSFLVGGLLLVLYTWYRFRCTLWYMANESPNLEPLNLSSVFETFINTIFRMQSIEFTFISTFIIWALSTIRREDISNFIGSGN